MSIQYRSRLRAILFVAGVLAAAHATANDGCRDRNPDDDPGFRRSGQEWRCIDRFSEGLAPIVLDDRYGYIDRDGRMAIPPRFSAAAGFNSRGTALVRLESQRQALIDRTGAVVREFGVDMEIEVDGGFPAGLARAVRWYPDFLANVDGRRLAPPPGMEIIRYDESAGLFIGEDSNGRQGLLDERMRWIGEPRFHTVSPFNDGIAAARDVSSGRWWLIDAHGQDRTTARYDRLKSAAPGLWLAEYPDGGDDMLLDSHGEPLVKITDEYLQDPFGPWFVHRPEATVVELVRATGERLRHDFAPKRVESIGLAGDGDGDAMLQVRLDGFGAGSSWRTELIDREGRRALPRLPQDNAHAWLADPVSAASAHEQARLPRAILRAYRDGAGPGVEEPVALGILAASGSVRSNPQWREFQAGDGAMHAPLVVRTEQGYGAIDGEGDWIMRKDYDSLSPFFHGWAQALREGQHYLVRADGREYPLPGTGGMDRSEAGIEQVRSRDDGLYRYYDIEAGRYLFDEGFQDAKPFRNGLAPVQVGTGWGFEVGSGWGLIDRKGEWRVPAGCRAIKPLPAGLWGTWCTRDDGSDSFVVLDRDGNPLSGQPWVTIYGNSDGLALVWLRKSASGDYVLGANAMLEEGIPLSADMIGDASPIGGGWARVFPKVLAGFVDDRGTWAIAPLHGETGRFSPRQRVAWVRDGRDYALIDAEGKTVFGPVAATISDVTDDGMFYVRDEYNRRTVIRNLGEGVRFEVKGAVEGSFGDGYFRYTDWDAKGKRGEVCRDDSGGVMRAARGVGAPAGSGGLLLQKEADGRSGFVGEDAVRAFPDRYLYATAFHDDRAVVMDEQGYRLIDRQGNTVVRVGEECGREVLLGAEGRRTWPATGELDCGQGVD